jgi:hypothetical protein
MRDVGRFSAGTDEMVAESVCYITAYVLIPFFIGHEIFGRYVMV